MVRGRNSNRGRWHFVILTTQKIPQHLIFVKYIFSLLCTSQRTVSSNVQKFSELCGYNMPPLKGNVIRNIFFDPLYES